MAADWRRFLGAVVFHLWESVKSVDDLISAISACGEWVSHSGTANTEAGEFYGFSLWGVGVGLWV
jgi:hypothetical protein